LGGDGEPPKKLKKKQPERAKPLKSLKKTEK